MNDKLLDQIAQALIDLLPQKTAQLVQAALDAGIEPRDVLLNGLAAGMKRVGELFACQEFFVPEVLMAARAMSAGMAVVRPRLTAGSVASRGKVVLGVVQGDIHDLGKNIVKVLLEADGYEVIDLGKDVPTETIVRAVAELKPDVLGLSSLMTTTMTLMPAIMKALEDAGLRPPLRVIVGGAPLTADYAQSIGADGYAADGPGAVTAIKRLINRE
jgi:5-methyltetrahydrofolate--homocysteine methyltransferase